MFKSLPEWNWEDHGVTPLVQAIPLEDGTENALVLYSAKPFALESGGRTANIPVEATSHDETPYIVLAFDNSVTDEQIQTLRGLGDHVHPEVSELLRVACEEK